MTPESITLVKESWAKVVPISETAAELFYGKLFELDPSVKPLFKTNDMKEQGRKLMAILNTAVNALDKLDTIVPAIQEMGKRHVDYGVKDEHYATVGEALIWTLGAGLKDDFTDDAKAAWIEVYTLVADTMIAAAAEKAA
ncbi:MAG: globin domain-containing protein [Gammaproteobacteria bacterium]|nr:globin domain-containing protein [Gammaproteobacteria bacterium]MCW8911388.1 globin domain-containing protein [Gammaproteobacteria bacterium]MCW9006207.1 globin domain-containing protein [Gammaproteobacteria bacterium]MCW9056226.1 globin domain-containing protein [Gammaproteobacteria bacterium]